MPLNNLIVQFLTKVLGVSEYFTAWKEVIMFLIILGLTYSLVMDSKLILPKIKKTPSSKLAILKLYWPILTALVLTILSLISSFVVNKTDLKVYAFGYLFELWWLNFFAIVCNWLIISSLKLKYLSKKQTLELEFKNKKFFKGLTLSIVLGFVLVSLVSLASLIIGPEKTLTPFGYGATSTNSQFVSTTPLCHNVDQSLPECRLMASFTQPIHYAGYLLFIIAFLVVQIFNQKQNLTKIFLFFSLLMSIYFVFQSYTRYAIMSVLTILTVALLYYLVSKKDLSLRLTKILVALSLLIPLIISVYVINLDPKTTTAFLPQSLAKEQSTDQHFRHAATSFKIVEKSGSNLIFGYGLGATGSASRPKYQNYENNPILKNFFPAENYWLLTSSQFLLTENWFVSELLNGGIFYVILYILIILIPFKSLYNLFKSTKYEQTLFLDVILSLGFFGIIIGNLFQHLWENQTLTIYWTIIWLWGRMLIWKSEKQKNKKNVDTIKPINQRS